MMIALNTQDDRGVTITETVKPEPAKTWAELHKNHPALASHPYHAQACAFDVQYPAKTSLARWSEWERERSTNANQSIFRLPHPIRAYHTVYEERAFRLSRSDVEAFAGVTPTYRVFEEALMVRYGVIGNMEEQLGLKTSVPDARPIGCTAWWWDLCGRHFVQTTDALEWQLIHSDLTGVETRYLRAPFPSCYVEFGETRSGPYKIEDGRGNQHVLEGAYIFESQAVVNDEYYAWWLNQKSERLRMNARGINEGEPIRVVHVSFTGSPIGRKSSFDDAYHDYTMVIAERENELPIKTLFERSWDAELEVQKTLGGNTADMGTDARQSLRDNLVHLVKALVYMGCAGARRRENREASEGDAALARRSERKRAKLQRRRTRLYDRIVVGPAQAIRLPGQPTGSVMTSHIRRGHWHTVLTGKGRTERELRYFQPIIVKADPGGQAPASKPYRVTATHGRITKPGIKR